MLSTSAASASPEGHDEIAALYHQVAAGAPLPIAMTAGPGHLLCGANPICCELLGAAPDVLLGQPLVDAVPADDARWVLALLDRTYHSGEAGLMSDTERPAPQHAQIPRIYIAWPIRDGAGRPTGLVVQIHDATARNRDRQALTDLRDLNAKLLSAALRERTLRRQLRQQLALVQALALTDDLTALANRRGFMLLAAQQLKLARRTGQTLSLFFLDLDRLKQINDRWGHTAGNQAIGLTARILSDTFRDSDIVARIGGDEFVVLAMDAAAQDSGRVRQRLEAQIARHLAQAQAPFQIELSMGVAYATTAQPSTLEELIAQADAQMYLEKQARRAR